MSRLLRFVLVVVATIVIFGPSIACAEYADVVLNDPDLIVYYRLNETTGTTAVDAGSSSLDATYYGSIPGDNMVGPNDGSGFDGLEASNTAPAFDGDSVDLPDSALDLEVITLTCFFKNSDTNKNHRLYCTNAGYAHPMTVALGGTSDFTTIDSLDVGLHSGLASKGSFINSSLLTDGQWHHLVVVRNSDTEADTDVYIDGVLSSTSDVGEGHSITGATTRLGNREQAAFGYNLPWVGGIDEAAFFGRAFTQADVTALYNAATGVPEPTTWMLLMGAAGFALFLRKRT